jgi:hypothetical protein
MLAALVLAAALAGTTVDLPDIFHDQIERIDPRTTVPILLPQTMPDVAPGYFPAGSAREHRWHLELGAAPNCNGATACFIADFRGRAGGRPSGSVKVDLARGRNGRFEPVHCGASCAPASVSWRERGSTYVFAAKVGRRALIRMANSAIRHGPRHHH